MLKCLKSFLSISLLAVMISACGPSPAPDGAITSEGTAKADRLATNKQSSTKRMPEDPALKSRYIQSCYGCHSAGAAGAPRSGDIAAWSPRLTKGMDALLTNTVNGINSMPPRGMCMDCSDEDFRALITFLIGDRTPPK
ncbi:MAG: cytochrome c5 [Zhongshania sp.]|jgi:cytochrome c5